MSVETSPGQSLENYLGVFRTIVQRDPWLLEP